MSNEKRRKNILLHAQDAGLDFVAYARKDCEDLPRGEIESALSDGVVTLEEIGNSFLKGIRKNLGIKE